MDSIPEINQIDFNTMNKIKPFYLKMPKIDPDPNHNPVALRRCDSFT